MDPRLQVKIDQVTHARNELYEAQQHVHALKARLEDVVRELQEACFHDFVAQLDGDYHSSRVEYVCTICDYWTRERPQQR